jgi:hypothetical protein
MSKAIQNLNITLVPGGYQAVLRLDDGSQATSVVFDDTDDAMAWASNYAEEAGADDQPLSPELKQTTTQVSQAHETEPETNSEVPTIDSDPKDDSTDESESKDDSTNSTPAKSEDRNYQNDKSDKPKK